MVADGGVVRARLMLDSSNFGQSWRKELSDMERSIGNSNISNPIQKQMRDAENAVSNFTTKASSGFKNLISQIEAVQNTSKGFGQSFANNIATPMVQNFQKARAEASLLQNQLNRYTAPAGFNNFINRIDSVESSLTKASNAMTAFQNTSGNLKLFGNYQSQAGIQNLFRDLDELEAKAIATNRTLNNLKPFGNYQSQAGMQNLFRDLDNAEQRILNTNRALSNLKPFGNYQSEAGFRNLIDQINASEKQAIDISNQRAESMAKYANNVGDLQYRLREAESSTAAYTGAIQTNYKAIQDWNKTSQNYYNNLTKTFFENRNAVSSIDNLNNVLNSARSSYGQFGQTLGADIPTVTQTMARDYDAAIQSMANSTKAGATTISSDLNAISQRANFNAMSNNFEGNIQKMNNSAKAGGQSIGQSLKSGLTSSGASDYMASIFGMMIAGNTWNYAQTLAGTKAMLGIKYDPGTANTYYSQEQAYTLKSSTSDQQIQNLLKYVLQTKGLQANETYAALNAIDAASTTPDPIQRIERLRNYGQYLTGASNIKQIFRGDVTDEQMAILEKGDKTPQDRIKAMEEVARQQGTMTKFGDSISTITLDTLPKYDQATQDAVRGQAAYNTILAASDTVMRGMAAGMTTVVVAVGPIAQWFNSLGTETQTLLGQILFFTGGLVVAVSTLKIFGELMSPLTNGIQLITKLSGLKLPDWLSGGKNIVTPNVNVEGANVNVAGATTGGVIGETGSKGTKNTGSGSRLSSLGKAAITIAGAATITGLAGIAILGSIPTVGSGEDKYWDDYCKKHPNSEACKKRNDTTTYNSEKNSGSKGSGGGVIPGAPWKSVSEKETAAIEKKYGINVVSKTTTTDTNNPPQKIEPSKQTNTGGLRNLAWNTSWLNSIPILGPTISGAYTSNVFTAGGLGKVGQGLLDWIFPKPVGAASTTNGTTSLYQSNDGGISGLLNGQFFSVKDPNDPNNAMPGAQKPPGATSVTSTGPSGGIQWPTKDDILNGIKAKILGTLGLPGNLTWDQVKETIKQKILSTLGLPGNLSWDKVKDVIKQKILNTLGLPGNLSWEKVKDVIKQKILRTLGLPGNLSWDKVKGWVMSKITGSLHLPGNISLDTVKSWVVGKLTGNGPAQGPGNGTGGGGGKSFGPSPSSFISRASGTGSFTYRGYGGSQQSLGTTLATKSGNCVDGTLAQIAEAERWGIPASMIYTYWNGNPHVAANIGGQVRDIANHSLTGNWGLPPAFGPGDKKTTTTAVNNSSKASVTLESNLGSLSTTVSAPVKTAMDTANKHAKTGVQNIGDTFNGLISKGSSSFWGAYNAIVPPTNSILRIINAISTALGGKSVGLVSAKAAGGGSTKNKSGASGNGRAAAGGINPFAGASRIPHQVVSWANQRLNGYLGTSNVDFTNLTGGEGAMAGFMAFANKLFSGFGYQFYYDHRQNSLLTHEGNCWDLSEALLTIAKIFNLGGGMVHTTWNGIGHMITNIGGRVLDPTNFVLHRNWAPGGQRSAGPAHVTSGNAHPMKLEVNIDLTGVKVIGVDDLVSKTRQAGYEGAQRAIVEFANPDPSSGN